MRSPDRSRTTTGGLVLVIVPSCVADLARPAYILGSPPTASGDCAIRILLTHPYFWPYVTRGAEREVRGAGGGLAARGHHVHLVTGQPDGVTSRRRVDGMTVRYVRTPLPAALARRGWSREAVFTAPASAASLMSRAEVLLSYYYSDFLGAARARRRRPAVLKLTGSVPRDRVSGVPIERGLLRRALDVADEVWVNSDFVVDDMSDWGRPMHVVPAGVDLEVFDRAGERDPQPLVVCAASPADPRKRLVDLIDAWPAILQTVPDARLLLVQSYDASARQRLLERLPTHARPTVTVEGPYDGRDLARVYSRAWVTVAPALYEALGLATLESLACGTPVVGADSGATAALLATPETGRLFRPADRDSLAAAVVDVLEGDNREADREVRRARALPYAWPTVVDLMEERLRALVR